MSEKQKDRLLMISVASVILFAFFFTSLIFGQISYAPIRKTRILFGAWTQGLFDSKTQKLHPEKLIQFEQLVHKKMSLAHYYIGWEALADPSLIDQFNTINSHGWEPVLNINPYYFSGCPATSLPLYRAIAQGYCDTFLEKAAKNLQREKHPFFLLFAWEMNNEQNTWSITMTGSTPGDFKAAWQHVYSLFKKEQVTNIVWVFCPNVPDNKTMSYQEFYPGDAYVDWIGLDGYNWGTTQKWSRWESFTEIFHGSYVALTKLAKGKPVMIAEFNTTDKGGNKADWYTKVLTSEISSSFPKVNALLIFNEDRTRQEHVDWRVDVNRNALEAFSEGIRSVLYQ